MNDTILKKWEPVAWAYEPSIEKLRLPVHVLSGEAIDVAHFCLRNWEPKLDRDGRVRRPGMKTAGGNGTFEATIASDLLELQQAFQDANTRYRLLVTGSAAGVMETAEELLDDLWSTLEWLFDDGKTDDGDRQLAALAAEHANVTSQDAMATALADFAELAERSRDKLTGLGGFDARIIEEARATAASLLRVSAGPTGPEAQGELREAYELRNRLGNLLLEKMQRVRSAARFVFRRHREVLPEVTSTYERRARAVRRKRAESEAPVQPEEPVTSPNAPHPFGGFAV